MKKKQILTELCFDTETTGLLAPSAANLSAQPHMIEFYGVKFVPTTGEIVDEFYSLVKPPIQIPPDTIRVHHIDDSMVKNAPSFISIYDKLYEFFLGEEVNVGHNIMFDVDILRYELARQNLEFRFPWPRKLVDTVEMSQSIFNKYLKLGFLHEHLFDEPIEDAHRAQSDVRANVRCYVELKKRGF